MICASLNKAPSRVALASGACQKPGVLGFQPASNTEQMVAEIGPAALVPASGVSCQHGSIFPQTLRILRLVSTLKPLHIVIHSLTCSTRVAVCGTRFSPKNHATVELAHAWFLPITAPILRFLHIALTCVVDAALRGVAVDLNRMYAHHREFLRLRIHLAWTIKTLLVLPLPFQKEKKEKKNKMSLRQCLAPCVLAPSSPSIPLAVVAAPPSSVLSPGIFPC